ncbi:ABC transporter permease [Kineosporia succinea]|uniref:ABC transport system permease protein n=1 Tax=Kineosporia succinea TaxID=84632 RepID=A0ABT9P2W1_9ACTN|nr:FtsX-like permease family protein [Kineosporia succinea]MDP9826832.1 putative ABC transport system permease protein [Kineosporia succinea]
MLSLSLAQLRTQAHRLVATVLAIVIAVGFVVATLVLNDTSKQTVYGALSSQYLNTDVVVTYDWQTSAGGETPDSDGWAQLAGQVEKLPGVAGVALDRSTYISARLPGSKGLRYGQVQSLADGDLRWQKLASGTWPSGPNQVVAAPGNDLEAGSTIEMQIQTVDQNGDYSDPETVTATVTGITDRAAGITSLGSQQFWTTPEQAETWGAIDTDGIRVAAAPGTDASALVTQVGDALSKTRNGGSLTVRTGEEQSAAVTKQMTADNAELTTVLLVFAAIAVFVCALVIANTFAVLLAQRVRELALLRAIGAAGKQLRRGVLVESFVIGVAASALGVLAGIGLAAGVSAIGSRYENSLVPLAGLSVHPMPVLVGMAVGVVVTMVAAFNPARKATKVAPLAAMRPMDMAPITTKGGLFRRIAGLLLAIPGVAVCWYAGRESNLLLATAGGMVTFVAVLLLARWLVPIAVALVGRVLGPAGQVPGKLAALNATRNPQRTAATATALIIGVTLTTTMVVGASTTRASASAALDDSYPTDVVIYAGTEDGMPATLAGTVGGVQNVTASMAVPGTTVKLNGEESSVLGVDPVKAGQVMRADDTGRVPAAGTISLPSWYEDGWGIKNGSAVKVTAGSREITLKARLVGDSINGPWVTSTDLTRLGGTQTVQEVWARLADDLSNGDRSDTLDAISDASADVAPDSSLSGSAQERASFDQLIDILLLIVLGLLAVAVVIAIIGVGNTMALSVLERRKESGVLRALGLTRGQLRWMLLWEAMLIAGVAAAVGVVLGSTYGVLAVKAALGNSGNVEISIPVMQVLAILVVATVAGALASVLPSRRAARISPVAAIASA